MVMPIAHLPLHRCPHCSTTNPTLARFHTFSAVPKKVNLIPMLGGTSVQWHLYSCASCTGIVSAAVAIPSNMTNYPHEDQPAHWVIPELKALSSDLPAKVAKFLTQARETLSSPSASIMVAASAVDAMLKDKSYIVGNLYKRIGEAEAAGLLTKDMAEWAHDVRLDANDERHADWNAADATGEDAKRCLDFAETLAELLFVLPARVKRGRKTSP